MTGIQNIPLRIPEQWDARWFDVFVREVLANADVRNATGSGVTVSGTADEAGTLTVDEVGLSGLEDIAPSTVLGRITAGTGAVEQLTAAQVRTLLVLATGDDVTFANITGTTADVGTGGFLVSSTKVVGAQGSAVASLTDSSGGTADGTLDAIGDRSEPKRLIVT